MAIAKAARAKQNLTDTIMAVNELLKHCTPEELLGGKAIAEILEDARRRMALLEDRLRRRLRPD